MTLRLFLVAALLCAVSAATCPPPGFDSVPDLDIDRYISAPWYIQKQIPVIYQREDQLYCVQAQYKRLNDDTVQVFNYANEGKVNGPSQTTDGQGSGIFGGRLLGKIEDLDDPSKLSVGFAGPTGDSPLFAGPYWIVALDDDYQWAIVTGGPPTAESNDACGYSNEGVNGNGFWLFSRKPIDPEATAIMEEKAKELGLDTSVLLPVEQKGCKYEGAGIPE